MPGNKQISGHSIQIVRIISIQSSAFDRKYSYFALKHTCKNNPTSDVSQTYIPSSHYQVWPEFSGVSGDEYKNVLLVVLKDPEIHIREKT